MKAIETERLILRDISSKDKHYLFINIFHDKKVLLYFLANYIDNEDDLSIDETHLLVAWMQERFIIQLFLKKTENV